MTSRLRDALVEAEQPPAKDQDAIASRLLAEVEAEQEWAARFAEMADDQWCRNAAAMRQDGATGRAHPLDEASPPDGPPRGEHDRHMRRWKSP